MTTLYKNLINGEMVSTDTTLEVLNPANEEVIGLVPSCGAAELDQAVAAARAAFKTWSKTPIEERQKVVQGISKAISDNMDELFRLLTSEPGQAACSGAARDWRSCRHVRRAGDADTRR